MRPKLTLRHVFFLRKDLEIRNSSGMNGFRLLEKTIIIPITVLIEKGNEQITEQLIRNGAHDVRCRVMFGKNALLQVPARRTLTRSNLSIEKTKAIYDLIDAYISFDIRKGKCDARI